MMTRLLIVLLALAAADMASAQAVTVRGRVVSDAGAPLRNAAVSQGTTMVRTDADGRFAIDATQSGAPLTVSKAGFVRQTFPMAPGELLVTMARGGALTVFVIDASGKPVPQANVTVTCSRSSWSGSPMDDRGQRRFGSLAPGHCDVSTGVGEPPPAFAGPPTPQALSARSEEMRARSAKERAEHLAKALGVDIRAGEDASIVLIGTAPTAALPLRTMGGNSVISGIILDEFGEPAEEALVQVQLVTGNSQPPPLQLPRQLPLQLPPGFVNVGLGSTTDDRGQFRVTGLPPGSYRVTAHWGRGSQAPPVFYPGRREMSDAMVVTVAADSETSNIDFALISGSQGTVIGQVLTSVGQVPSGASAQLVSAGPKDSAPRQVASVPANRQGQFTIGGVAPGTYELQVLAASSYVFVTHRRDQAVAAPLLPSMEFGRSTLTVSDTTPATVSVRTAPSSSLRGRIDVEGDRGTLTFSDIRLMPVGDSTRSAAIAADGTFDMRNLYGETRMALAARTPGWWLKSFMVGGVNAADEPVDFSNGSSPTNVRVVLARAAIVSGTVTSAGASGRIVVFPVELDRRYSGSRYVRTALIGRDGRYTLDVPPGQYWVVALEGSESLTEALMTRLQSMSTQVTASETRATQADLAMVRLPQ